MNGLPMIGVTQNATTTLPAQPSLSVTPVRAAAPTRLDNPHTEPATPAISASSAASVANEPVSFPVSLQFDQETHRFIIEARDRVSGFVVFQVPFKAAISAADSSTPSTARGNRVNREA
jgi:hypothetical protein